MREDVKLTLSDLNLRLAIFICRLGSKRYHLMPTRSVVFNLATHRPCSARRSRDEWIGIEVPATIPRDLFEREQPIELASETPGRRNSCPA